MIAIIFGINGQDGQYLSNILRLKGVQIIGVSRSTGNWLTGDISDYSFVETLIKINKPDFIFHLAANSTARHTALLENHNTISTGTINVLEAAYKFVPNCKVFLSGSALQFKNVGEPIDEHTVFDANSAYSVSRIHSVYAGRYYREKLGLKVYVGYFFNHDSPLRTENHVNQKIVRAIQRITNGSAEKLELGNILVKKEFNFAGDVVEAVWMLVNQQNVFEAVIGSGVSYSIKQWLECCFNIAGKNWEEYVTKNESFVAEYDILVSKPFLIQSIGWKPNVNLRQLAQMMMQN